MFTASLRVIVVCIIVNLFPITGAVVHGAEPLTGTHDQSNKESPPLPFSLSWLVDATVKLAVSGGLVAYAWNWYIAHWQFLHVELTLSESGNYLLAHTKVENKRSQAIPIDNSLLLIGPEDEDPIFTANQFLDAILVSLKTKQDRLSNRQRDLRKPPSCALSCSEQLLASTNDSCFLNESECALQSKIESGVGIKYLDDLEGAELDRPLFDGKGRALIPIRFYYYENVNISDERTGYDVPVSIEQLKPISPSAVRFMIFSLEKTRLCHVVESTFIPVSQPVERPPLHEDSIGSTVSSLNSTVSSLNSTVSSLNSTASPLNSTRQSRLSVTMESPPSGVQFDCSESGI
jgi:hypothetical protein